MVTELKQSIIITVGTIGGVMLIINPFNQGLKDLFKEILFLLLILGVPTVIFSMLVLKWALNLEIKW